MGPCSLQSCEIRLKHQQSWNLLVITRITIVDAHILCDYVGVDKQKMLFKRHQHRVNRDDQVE
jgi:hypothetical protein